jgi:signal peptidase I
MGLTVGILMTGWLTSYLPSLVQQRVDIFEIPSQSMLPTLQVGDRLLVDQPVRRCKTGDVVVFSAPPGSQALDAAATLDKFYIKRVIGQTVRVERAKYM